MKCLTVALALVTSFLFVVCLEATTWASFGLAWLATLASATATIAAGVAAWRRHKRMKGRAKGLKYVQF